MYGKYSIRMYMWRVYAVIQHALNSAAASNVLTGAPSFTLSLCTLSFSTFTHPVTPTIVHPIRMYTFTCTLHSNHACSHSHTLHCFTLTHHRLHALSHLTTTYTHHSCLPLKYLSKLLWTSDWCITCCLSSTDVHQPKLTCINSQ